MATVIDEKTQDASLRVGVAAAALIGYPTFRLRGHYFALAMLAYPLARMRFRGAPLLAIMVAVTYLIPQSLLLRADEVIQ